MAVALDGAMANLVASVLLWMFAFYLIVLCFPDLSALGLKWTQHSRDLEIVRRAHQSFLTAREKLSSGWVLEESDLERIKGVGAPWGKLALDAIEGIRLSGGALSPTLQRLQAVAFHHEESLKNARARVSQTIAQATVGAALAPVLGILLYALLPGLESFFYSWIGACFFASMSGMVAGLWVYHMAEVARWGGVKSGHRVWLLEIIVFFERILAFIRSGVTPDVAWNYSYQDLPLSLQRAWGATLWGSEESLTGITPLFTSCSKLELYCLGLGVRFKELLKIACMEGVSTCERVESFAAGVRLEIESHQKAEVEKLGIKALQPLFILVAPSILGLFAYGLYLSLKAEGYFGG